MVETSLGLLLLIIHTLSLPLPLSHPLYSSPSPFFSPSPLLSLLESSRKDQITVGMGALDVANKLLGESEQEQQEVTRDITERTEGNNPNPNSTPNPTSPQKSQSEQKVLVTNPNPNPDLEADPIF
jgi:hypothetical protein